MPVDQELLEILACPICKQEVKLVSLDETRRTGAFGRTRAGWRCRMPRIVARACDALEAFAMGDVPQIAMARRLLDSHDGFSANPLERLPGDSGHTGESDAANNASEDEQ